MDPTSFQCNWKCGYCVVATHGSGAYKTYFENNWDITSVETVDANAIQLNLYPNPTVANATLTFDNTKAEEIQVSVLNASGQMVSIQKHAAHLGTNEINISMSHLSQGMYYVRMVNSEGSFTKAISKQ